MRRLTFFPLALLAVLGSMILTGCFNSPTSPPLLGNELDGDQNPDAEPTPGAVPDPDGDGEGSLISGTVSGSAGGWITVTATHSSNPALFFRAMRQGDGEYTISAVPDGSYSVSAQEQGTTNVGTYNGPVAVSGSPVTGIDITLTAP